MNDQKLSAQAVEDEVRFDVAGVLVEFRLANAHRATTIMLMVEVGPAETPEPPKHRAQVMTVTA